MSLKARPRIAHALLLAARTISAIVAISRFSEILRQFTQALKWSATMNNSTMTTAPTIFTDCETFAVC
jgi:hypothetical protein